MVFSINDAMYKHTEQVGLIIKFMNDAAILLKEVNALKAYRK